MSKRSRTRHEHANPTTERNRRKERAGRLEQTVFQEEAAKGHTSKQSRKRYSELSRFHGRT